MAGVTKRQRTAGDIIFDRMRVPEDGSPVRHPWPSGAHLIPSDEEWTGQALIEAARERKTIVLFFPDGEEVILTPSTPDDRP
jgi:hypothetical protein